MRIERVVAIISHNEHVAFRDAIFRHVVLNLLPTLTPSLTPARSVQLAVFHLNFVAFQRDYSFDEDFFVHLFRFSVFGGLKITTSPTSGSRANLYVNFSAINRSPMSKFGTCSNSVCAVQDDRSKADGDGESDDDRDHIFL